MNKRDGWDKSSKILMCIFTGVIAISAMFTAFATWQLAYKKVPQLSESIENIAIERGRCLNPFVIHGKITYGNKSSSGATVTIVNQNTGDEKNITTNENGEYAEDAGNFPNCWVGGDKIKFSACSENKCSEKREIVFKLEGGGMRVDLEI